MTEVTPHDPERFRAEVRQFVEKEIYPHAAEWDAKEQFPWDQVKEMGRRGYLGIFVPEEYGGMGLDYLPYAIASEEAARGCGSCGVIVSVNNSLACFPVKTYGSEEQKRKYLTPMAKGEQLGCFALTEPNAGSDPIMMSTLAKRTGDEYIISGTKRFITTGANSRIAIVFAKTSPELKHKGISAFIVDKERSGVKIDKHEEKLGIRASDTDELVFDDVRVPKENLLGNEGDGFKIAMDTLDCGRIGIGAQAVGIAQRALEESLAHAKTRVQFGQPIGKNQAISTYLADMATQIEAARLMVYKACHVRNSGARSSVESAMAKMFASDVAMQCSITACQIMGSEGVNESRPAARLMRDAKITQIYEGTNEIMRVIVASGLIK
jgi:butyryl-CoA dehydrogenase